MKNLKTSSLKLFLLIFGVMFITCKEGFSQTYWQTTGNTVGSTDFLGTINNAPLNFEAYSSAYPYPAMAILGGGYVGIGTSTPSELLDVDGTANFNADNNAGEVAVFRNHSSFVFINTDMTGNGDYNGISLIKDNGIFWTDGIRSDHKNTSSGFVIAPWSASTQGIRIDGAGNVGIGTAYPAYALDVAGTIRAYEVKVCLSGCDFVFDKSYNLMPFEELEQYLQLNHHLPGVASAKEMESGDGVEIGKMDSQLLQKVEELTLYIIQQDKKLNELEKKVAALGGGNK